ncbi:MAG: hypothetical protein HUU21_39480 [Polyangiaceae bacterium]|nr:hypothetical protein [Polyangiaceae bacterium]
MAITNFTIVINYITEAFEEHTIILKPEEYFDMDDTDDRYEFDVDSTPKHREVREYIKSNELVRQARVRVTDRVRNNLWEVTESYWSQHGDDGVSVAVLEMRDGVTVGWNKYISIRLANGHERVLKFVKGDTFPLLDEYVVIENDTFIEIIYPERAGLFKKNENYS